MGKTSSRPTPPAPTPIDPARLATLNQRPVADGKFVLYWMQASQRTRFNHALEHAIARGNELGLPVVVVFGLMDDYPEANQRHYAFMLRGLADVHTALADRGIRFVVRHGQPPDVAIAAAADAALLVSDRGYLRHQKRWRDAVADAAPCRVEQVESDAVVPADQVSDKQEFAARTIRPKILKLLPKYLAPLPPTRISHPSTRLRVAGDIDVTDPDSALSKLKLDRSVSIVTRFVGGEIDARRRLDEFVAHRLAGYAENRREPGTVGSSTLAPYLHFGQISPLDVALRVRDADAPESDRDAFLEELIVRRELSINFVHHNPEYDKFDSLPEWAQKTLAEHRPDARPVVYSRAQLESAGTYDELWNAAQREMNASGFMHNSMRMYWGKKILEWKPTAREAFEDALYLNNKFFLCGRDPASYANVAWLFGLHDRPWGERQIFGKIRYMNAAGLNRKFDMAAYLKFVEGLELSPV